MKIIHGFPCPLQPKQDGLHSPEQNKPREEQSYSPEGEWLLSSLTSMVASIMSSKDWVGILEHISVMKEKQRYWSTDLTIWF